MHIRKLHFEIIKMEKQIKKIKDKLIIMEINLNELKIIINQKRVVHGESLADKIAKMIMNHPKKKVSQRELLRRYSDKRLSDIIATQKILEWKYYIKTLVSSRQKVIYYYENPETLNK